MWHIIDPLADYTRHLLSLVHEEQIRGKCQKIIVDPLYRAGIGYVESVLGVMAAGRSLFTTVCLFRGVCRSVENNLSQLREGAAIGSGPGRALDGDADRFGIIDRTGKFYPK